MLKKLSQIKGVLKKGFAAKQEPKSPEKPAKNTGKIQETSSAQTKPQQSRPVPDLSKYKFCGGVLNMYDVLTQGGNPEDLVDMEYRQYPYDIPHWNPESPEYIPSPREEARLIKSIKAHNDIIDGFKRDIKIQRQYIEAIQHLERPYLTSGVPGINANVYSEVKDYAQHFPGEQKNEYHAHQEALDTLVNEKWPINQSAFHKLISKPSNILEWEEELRNRPVTGNFHEEKSNKFDVRVPLEERYPHVADRLGHPEIFPTPFETLLRLERPLCHPGFLDQPFVKIPSAEPDADVDFTAGPVLYENPNMLEWGRFWLFNHCTVFAYVAMWNLYLSVGASSSPSFRTREDIGGVYYDQNWYNFDSYQLFPVLYTVTGVFYLWAGMVRL